MTAPISDTIKVTVSTQIPRVSRKGFGNVLVMDPASWQSELVGAYTSLDDMRDAGCGTDEPAYKKAQAFFAQDPIYQFLVGRASKTNVADIQVLTIAGTPTTGDFKIKLGSVTSGVIAHDADAAAIEVIVEAMSNVTAATVTKEDGVITISVTNPEPHIGKITIVDNGLEDGDSNPCPISVEVEAYGFLGKPAVDCFNDIKEYNNDFYGVIATRHFVEADIKAMATAIQTDVKHYAALLDNSSGTYDGVFNPSVDDDICSYLKGKSISKTSVIMTKTADNEPDAAILGRQLSRIPGSSSFMYKTLVGVMVDKYTTGERNAMRAKRCNYYESQGGKGIFKDGITPVGEWIDIVIGMDYLAVRTEEFVFANLSAPEKIGWDELDIIESLVLNSMLLYGVSNRFITKDSIKIVMPQTIDPMDKADRKLKTIKASAELVGAIHYVNVDMTLFI